MSDNNYLKAELSFSGFDYNNPRHFTEFGGDDSNPTWEEYLSSYKEEIQPYVKAIKEYIEREGLMRKCANEIYAANDNLHFVFKDGTRFAFSWRAWGDLMQAIVGKREGYLRYYFSGYE